MKKKLCLQEIGSEGDNQLCNKTKRSTSHSSSSQTVPCAQFNLISISHSLTSYTSAVCYPLCFSPLPHYCMIWHSTIFLTGPVNSHCSFCHTWLTNSHTQEQFNNRLCFLSCWFGYRKVTIVYTGLLQN